MRELRAQSREMMTMKAIRKSRIPHHTTAMPDLMSTDEITALATAHLQDPIVEEYRTGEFVTTTVRSRDWSRVVMLSRYSPKVDLVKAWSETRADQWWVDNRLCSGRDDVVASITTALMGN